MYLILVADIFNIKYCWLPGFRGRNYSHIEFLKAASSSSQKDFLSLWNCFH
jgi:hypothetical protein